jgi:hypothetical protein
MGEGGGSLAGGVEEEEEEGSSADAVEEDSPTGSSGGGAPKSKGEKKTEGNGNRHSPLDKLGSARTPKSGPWTSQAPREHPNQAFPVSHPIGME